MSNVVFPSLVRGLTFNFLRSSAFDTLIQSSPTRSEVRLAQMQNPIWSYSLIYDYLMNTGITNGLAYTDLQQLMGFYLARQGSFDDFLFDDTDDDLVGPALATNTWPGPGVTLPLGYSVLDSSNRWQKVTTAGTTGGSLPTFTGTTTSDGSVTWTNQGTYTASGYPNPNATLQVVASGGTSYSPLQRIMSGQFNEDVTDLAPSIAALSVFANGTSTGSFSVLGPGLALPGVSFSGLYLQWSGTPATPVTATFGWYHRVRFDMDDQDWEKFTQFAYTIGGSEGRNGSGFMKLITARNPQL